MNVDDEDAKFPYKRVIYEVISNIFGKDFISCQIKFFDDTYNFSPFQVLFQ